MDKQYILYLQRVYGEQGTNGTITYRDEQVCHTIELPWKNNLRRVSCIPEGRYRLIKHKYHKNGEQIGIPHVPNREAILIHKANNAADELQGCIAPVMKLTGEGLGNSSAIALERLKAVVYPLLEQEEEVFLIIKSVF